MEEEYDPAVQTGQQDCFALFVKICPSDCVRLYPGEIAFIGATDGKVELNELSIAVLFFKKIYLALIQ